jgi:hypothetical protein
MNEKFGVVNCFHCGYIQGRELVGLVFGYQGSFKSVVCYNCKKSISLTTVNVLFKSNSSAATHEWLVVYKKQMRGTEEFFWLRHRTILCNSTLTVRGIVALAQQIFDS